ncbi:hypothetical protein [Legionella waltersii]|uniref:Thioesterase domain-containing protein n=1 Tax=Legionella waltersii TaxID=66969 RepID=A0A0W1ANA1_9GAMM|nr:hypothetical protein [Legionella waltersii]KTD82817.1 hypothetical protein Lwal_0295 [Legionella waltersii]SNV01531.1 Uncharacterised protein [Legionella waltersii]
MNYFNVNQVRFFKAFLLILVASVITSCVDLSGSRSSYRKNHSTQTPPQKVATASQQKKAIATKQGRVYTMLGGLGLFSKGMYRLSDSVNDTFHVPANSSMWYNAGHLSQQIINRYYKEKVHTPIILVGHSLGANEQIKVARNLNAAGVPVDLLVTVDAVSQTIVPPNVKEALNMYKPGFVPMFSGLKLRAVNPQATKIYNVNVGEFKSVKVNHFTIDKDDTVQAMIMDKIDKVLVDGNKKRA